MNIIVTGKVQCGKTSWCTGYCRWLIEQKLTVGGILCPEARNNNLKVGYNVIDIQTKRSVLFSRFTSEADFPGEPVGDYLISDKGLEFAKRAIEKAIDNGCSVVFMDEVGYLELAGKGVIESVKMAYQVASNTVTVVRKSLLSPFLKYFHQEYSQKGFSIKDIEMDTSYLIPKRDPLPRRFPGSG